MKKKDSSDIQVRGLYIENNLKSITQLLKGKKIEDIIFNSETKQSYWSMSIVLEGDYMIRVDGINKPMLV